MAQTLSLKNYRSGTISEQTLLTTDVAAGSTSLPVANTNDFTSGVFVLIGGAGGKDSEIILSTPTSSATSIPLSAPTSLAHNQREQVYALFGDKLNIYRAANIDGSVPADSAFALLTTISIDPNDADTVYTDASGGGGYWYKYTNYNSITGAETNLSAATAVRGLFTVNYCSLDDIRREAGFTHAVNLTDDQIDEKRQAAQDEINGALSEFYNVPFQPPINSQLKQICIVLAAGYLLRVQYGHTTDRNLQGQSRIDWAEAELQKLIMKERVLVGKDGRRQALPGATGGADGWPNSSTATAPASQGGAPRLFRMSDIQGIAATDSSGNPVGNLYYGRRW